MFRANSIGRRSEAASGRAGSSVRNLPVPYRAPAMPPVAPVVVIRPHERLRAHEPQKDVAKRDDRLRGLIVDILV